MMHSYCAVYILRCHKLVMILLYLHSDTLLGNLCYLKVISYLFHALKEHVCLKNDKMLYGFGSREYQKLVQVFSKMVKCCMRVSKMIKCCRSVLIPGMTMGVWCHRGWFNLWLLYFYVPHSNKTKYIIFLLLFKQIFQ